MPSNQDPANSGRFRKSSNGIDPPDLPSWSRLVDETPAPLVAAPMPEDETPTLSRDEMPVPAATAEPVEDAAPIEAGAPRVEPPAREAQDPRDLARRLAEEAKKRLARSATAPAAVTPPEPPPSDVKLETKKEVPQMPAEDPRDLARRLAEEAKRRLHETPAPVQHRSEADRSPEAQRPPAPPPEPRSLHERFAPAGGGKMSAADALNAAREAERRRREAPPEPDRGATAPPPEVRAEPPRQAAARTMPPPDVTPAPAGARAPVSSSPPANLAAVVLELLPGASVEAPIPVTNIDVFRALWRAHRARALHEHDLNLVATASVLIEAAEHIAPGWLVAGRVVFGGQTWAVWVDLERKALLGVARPPEVYLAGL